MIAVFDDPAMLEEDDQIGVPHVAEVVRGEERGPARGEAAERRADRALTVLVQPVVGSSSNSTGASRTIARAVAMRCRWPPDSVAPRSPSTVS